MNDMHTDHEGYDMDIDELRPAAPEYRTNCTECGREHWTDAGHECEGCRALNSRPGTCLQEGCSGKLAWAYKAPRVAECQECDARFTVETLRTLALGELVKRVIAETKTGSAAEVGAFLLREGRASLRRVS